MMNLREYEGKKVIIESTNRKIYRGIINDYVYPEDNENGKESIIIDATNYDYPMEFYVEDIKTIEIIE